MGDWQRPAQLAVQVGRIKTGVEIAKLAPITTTVLEMAKSISAMATVQ